MGHGCMRLLLPAALGLFVWKFNWQVMDRPALRSCRFYGQEPRRPRASEQAP